ncbi:MAG: HAMP domain-containing protein [Acidobacteria bacterium]|nr:HAMP domain-containing protein [Acidobacteriota bacterium]
MRPLTHLSIQSKIIGIILLTNVLGLGLAVSLIIRNDLAIFHRELATSAHVIGQVAGAYNVIPLNFDDPTEAEISLAKLDTYDHLLEAYIFDNDDHLFAQRVKTPLGIGLPNVRNPSSGFHDGYLEVWEPIVERGVRYGTIALRFSTEHLDNLVREYRRKMLSVLLLVLAISAVFSFFLGRIISGPILQLADVARTISNDGDYSIRVKKTGRDEIATLCDVFNDMLQQIQSRQRELERSNRELDHFAYVTSHDLKAPLRAIASLAQWLEEDLADDLTPEGREQLEMLRGRVRRMESLINGILEYSRIGRIDSDVEEVQVGALIREITDMIEVREGLRIEVEDPMPTLRTKRLRLQQVFANLITNAVKYHDKPQGVVQVGARDLGDRYEFFVSDDGPGIAPRFQKKVFMIFQTLHARDQLESTGVGLALVKKIVEGEGGVVTLESVEGSGTTFRFTWPRGHKEHASAA